MKMLPFALLVFFCIPGCFNQREPDETSYIGHFGDVNEDDIYFDYRISANEEDDNLTIFLRFMDGPEGETLVISEPAKVELDGELIKVDSSGRTGAFYELQKRIAGFAGQHQIVFSGNNKKYTEKFWFEPMVLKTVIPDTISREDLVLELEGLEQEDHVRVIVLDTSIHNEGINRLDTVINGKILLNSFDLNQLATGPIHLELHRENERDLENGTETGGRIYLTYTLKRDFYLKD
jgi:hypothetical protein